MSDETIIELARLLAETTRARRLAEGLVERDGHTDDLDERDPDVAEHQLTLAQARADAAEEKVAALTAQVKQLRADLEELSDTHEHTQATLIDVRANLSDAVKARDGALAEVRDARAALDEALALANANVERTNNAEHNAARERAEYQTKIDRIMRVFAGLVDTANDHGVYADLATIRASFNTARDIARGEP